MALPNKNISENSYILEGQRVNNEHRGSIDSDVSAFDDMKQLIDENPDEKRTTLPFASFNFINSIIGSGVIGIPYALHEAGFGFGLVLLVFVAYVTDYSLILMVRSGHLCGKFSYQGIMEAAFGRPGYILLGILQFIYPFIAMVSYNVVVGDTVTKVIVRITGIDQDSIFAKREMIVFIATLLVTIPLCLYRDIAKLAKISFLSLVCVAFILIAIFVRMGSMSEIIPPHPDSWKFINYDIVPSIGIMAFAFMCHHNTFLIYSSIQEATQHRWDAVTHTSILTSLIVSMLFGIAGYTTFTAYSQGARAQFMITYQMQENSPLARTAFLAFGILARDLLENYCWDDDLMNFSRILFSATILLTYPIECFVTRDVVEHAFIKQDPNVPMSERTHYMITLIIVSVTYFISIATDCLGVVLELNGVLAAVPLAYILPAISYLKLEEGNLLSQKKLPALGLAIFGSVVAFFGVILLMVDFEEVDTCSHGKVMPYCENFTNRTSIS